MLVSAAGRIDIALLIAISCVHASVNVDGPCSFCVIGGRLPDCLRALTKAQERAGQGELWTSVWTVEIPTQKSASIIHPRLVPLHHNHELF